MHPGDSIDSGYAGMNTRRGRVWGSQIAPYPDHRNPQGHFIVDLFRHLR
ncbi:MAG: hypothetical protein ACLU7M_01975 [Mediterraneibacter gnavus]